MVHGHKCQRTYDKHRGLGAGYLFGSELTLKHIRELADQFRSPPLPRTMIVPPLDNASDEILEAIEWIKSEGCGVYESKFSEPDLVFWLEKHHIDCICDQCHVDGS